MDEWMDGRMDIQIPLYSTGPCSLRLLLGPLPKREVRGRGREWEGARGREREREGEGETGREREEGREKERERERKGEREIIRLFSYDDSRVSMVI